MTEELTSVQISTKARDRLKEIASFYHRSMAGQLEWMIEQIYNDLSAEWGGASKNGSQDKDQLELPINER